MRWTNMKKLETMVETKLLPILQEKDKNAQFEYMLDGFIAPAYRYMLSVASAGLLIGYLASLFFSFNFVYAIIIMLVILYVGLQLLYTDVYIGKSGKRVFIYKKGFLRKEVIEILPIIN